MRRFLLASAICLFPLTQVTAETITIDGIIDKTPGQIFRNAGAALNVSFGDNGKGKYNNHVFVIADIAFCA